MAQIASRQNSVNYHNREQIDIFISQKQIMRRKGRLARTIHVVHMKSELVLTDDTNVQRKIKLELKLN